jgi:bla regulator protein BlaR1
VGDSLERALDVIGKPVKTVVGKENNFEDGVLYKDIEGRKGYCYYARTDRKIRLWFGNYKIMSIYTTRSNYGDASSRKMEKADIPQTSTIDEKGRIIDKIDYPFINDPEAIGAWESVDFVQEIEYFKPGVKSFGGDLFLKELFVLEEGKTNWAWRWTKGLFLHPVDKTASKYLIKDIDGTTYMFFEWKSGDYVFRHTKPSFYVLKKVNKPYVESRITDNIDYPFVNEPEIVGTWKSIDFVNTPDEFKPDSLRWKGELILKELVFLPDGKMKNSQDTWTKGLVLDPANKTASRYIIKKIDDSAYMLYELKNGDYIYRGMKPKYYVFKKE